MSIQDLSALLYADNGLVASPESARLQVAFDSLTGLFNLVILWTNERKTVSMEYWPRHTPQAW